jgi:hypothetical protein
MSTQNNNPYPANFLASEAWQRGYDGKPKYAPGSAAVDGFYNEGVAARMLAATAAATTVITDEQMTAGATVLANYKDLPLNWRNAAIDVFQAMVDAYPVSEGEAQTSAAVEGTETKVHFWWRGDHAEWRECMGDEPEAVEFTAVVPPGYKGTSGHYTPRTAPGAMTDARIAEIYEQATSYPLADDDHHGAIAFARALLAAPTAQQSLAGYVLVPLEPTGVMKDAGASSIPVSAASAWVAADVYRAMIAAAKPGQSLTAGGAVPELTDEGIVKVLASFGIDSTKSKYGFDALQVATTVPSIRRVVETYLAAAPLPQVQSEALDWVKVSDRLPHKTTMVLVTDGADHALAYQRYDMGETVWCDAHNDEVRDVPLTFTPKHWLEIPHVQDADQQPVTPSGALADNDGGVK